MSQYGIYQAKSKLTELIKEVERGGVVTITNRGVPVANIVRTDAAIENQTRNAIVAIKRMRTEKIDSATFNELRILGRK